MEKHPCDSERPGHTSAGLLIQADDDGALQPEIGLQMAGRKIHQVFDVSGFPKLLAGAHVGVVRNAGGVDQGTDLRQVGLHRLHRAAGEIVRSRALAAEVVPVESGLVKDGGLRSDAAAYPGYRILLIWDQAGWHRSQELRVPPNIQIECLPAYSPELNPVERLWRWLRRHVSRNRLFECEEELMDALAKALRALTPSQLASLCHCSYLYNIDEQMISFSIRTADRQLPSA